MGMNPVSALLAVLVLVYPVVAGATDAVDDWNGRAIAAMNTGKRPQVAGFIDVTIIQAAVYDALNAIDGGAFHSYARASRRLDGCGDGPGGARRSAVLVSRAGC